MESKILKYITVILLILNLFLMILYIRQQEEFKRIKEEERKRINCEALNNGDEETLNNTDNEKEDVISESSTDNKEEKNNNSENKTNGMTTNQKPSNTNNINTSVKQEEKKIENQVANENNSESSENQTIWRSLGMSEYDYYNKPMWNWARVDYSVKVYGSLENARKKCIEDGDKTEQSYACTSINSYSGDYLGEMLRIHE